jgi:tetratricopeptide (TPR) repeat protein
MKLLMIGVMLGGMLVLTGCATHKASTRPETSIVLNVGASGEKAADADMAKVHDALKTIQSGKVEAAINGPLTQVIHKYETRYANKKVKVFCAQTSAAALVYAASASAAAEKAGVKPQSSVQVIGPAWAMAYWATGYGYNAITHYGDAEAALKKALALSPMNSQYKSELAYSYQRQKHWKKSLALYQEAEDDAEITAKDVPAAQCLALRGQGYALVELHRLADAKKAYKSCLKLIPHEPKSLGELAYIRKIEKQIAGH